MVTALKLSEHIRRNQNLGIVDVGIGPLQKGGEESRPERMMIKGTLSKNPNISGTK